MKILILIILTTILTGCLDISKTLYDVSTERYLKASREFNNEYMKNHTIESYNWSEIQYINDSEDIFRCPAYTINKKGADCDGFAYLAVIEEKEYPFAFFLLIEEKNYGHVVAFFRESATTYTIYSNQFKIKNQTIDGYLKLYAPTYKYVAQIDINLHKIKSWEED